MKAHIIITVLVILMTIVVGKYGIADVFTQNADGETYNIGYIGFVLVAVVYLGRMWTSRK
jgi:Mg2+ and Co2+ transporter CorA